MLSWLISTNAQGLVGLLIIVKRTSNLMREFPNEIKSNRVLYSVIKAVFSAH